MATRLIIAIFDTEQNQRTKYTTQTLDSLLRTVRFDKHELFLSDNGSCQATQDLYKEFEYKFHSMFPPENLTIRYNGKNWGTGMGVNFGIKDRKEGWKILKTDNDVVWHQSDWVEELEECIDRQPKLGVVGGKRTDLEQNPYHENEWFRTEYILLPRERGMSWLVVEKSADIMGTCTMLNPKLIDTIGYYWQPDVYGFEDNIYCVKSELAGFANAFHFGIKLSHIDDGQNSYTQEKQKISGAQMGEFSRVVQGLRAGTIPIYYNPFENEKAN